MKMLKCVGLGETGSIDHIESWWNGEDTTAKGGSQDGGSGGERGEAERREGGEKALT